MGKLKIDIHGDTKALEKRAKQLQKAFENIGKEGRAGAKKSNKAFGDLNSTLKRTAAAYLTWKSVGVAKDMVVQGAQIIQTKDAFESLAKASGDSSDKVLKDLKKMSGGAVSDFNLMQAAARSSLLGIGFKEQIKLMEIARATSRATGQSVTKGFDDITLAVGRQSKMILDNLGIVLSVEKANEAYAKELGVTASSLNDTQRKQAFLNATFKAGAVHVKNLGVDTKSTAEEIATSVASMNNAIGDLKIDLATGLGPTIQNLSTSFSEFLQGLHAGKIQKLREELNTLQRMRSGPAMTARRERIAAIKKELELLQPQPKTIKQARVEYTKKLEVQKQAADKVAAEAAEIERINDLLLKSNTILAEKALLSGISKDDMKIYKENEKIQKKQAENFKNFKESQYETHKAVLDAGLEYEKEIVEKQKELEEQRRQEIESRAVVISDSFAQNVNDVLFGYKKMEEGARAWSKVISTEIGKVIAKWISLKVVKAFTGGSGVTTQADGGVWSNGVQMMAKGGLINQPTLFNTKGGYALGGEAGPEAIMPVAKGKDGKLGVINHGDGGGKKNITINYNITAFDSKSVEEMVEQNQSIFMNPLNKAIQQGDRGTINNLRSIQ